MYDAETTEDKKEDKKKDDGEVVIDIPKDNGDDEAKKKGCEEEEEEEKDKDKERKRCVGHEDDEDSDADLLLKSKFAFGGGGGGIGSRKHEMDNEWDHLVNKGRNGRHATSANHPRSHSRHK